MRYLGHEIRCDVGCHKALMLHISLPMRASFKFLLFLHGSFSHLLLFSHLARSTTVFVGVKC